MEKKRILLIVGIAVVVFVGFMFATKTFGEMRMEQLESEATRSTDAIAENLDGEEVPEQETDDPRPFINFDVRVPETTPQREPIVLHYGLNMAVMNKTSELTYSAMLPRSVLKEQISISYGYSRGGRIEFGEYGLKGYAADQMPRKFFVGDSNNADDVVERWKWLPTEPLNEIDIPTQAETKVFESRSEFWKGAYMPDFWSGNGEWELNYDQTIENLKEKGFDWIALKPPVSEGSNDPIQYVLDQSTTCPSYPEDGLRKHIRVFKDAGFKVLVSVQLCTSSYENKDDAWWKQWYDEAERVVQYHADIVREENADALVIAFSGKLPKEADAPSFASKEWSEIIDAAESAGVPISFSSGAWGADWGDPNALPHPLDNIDFMDRLDFFDVGIHNTLFTDNSNPTQEEVDEAMGILIGRLDRLHEITGKPVIASGVAYQSIVGSGMPKGPEVLYVYEDPDAVWDKYDVEYSAEQQAMVYESVMREISERPYIEGVFTWGYTYVDATLTPDETIRGKMAERILSKWFQEIDN